MSSFIRHSAIMLETTSSIKYFLSLIGDRLDFVSKLFLGMTPSKKNCFGLPELKDHVGFPDRLLSIVRLSVGLGLPVIFSHFHLHLQNHSVNIRFFFKWNEIAIRKYTDDNNEIYSENTLAQLEKHFLLNNWVNCNESWRKNLLG